MPRWQELPDPLDQRVRQLVVQLRRLKDRSGLSLAALASKTGYSRSSWERYLNGKALPPRHAVEELARVAGADPVRLLVLHEVAEEARQQAGVPSSSADGREAGAPGAEGDAAVEGFGAVEGPPASAGGAGVPESPEGASVVARPRGVRGVFVLAAVVVAALLGLGAGMLIAQSWDDNDGGGDQAPVGVGTPTPRPGSNTPTTTAQGPGRYVFTPGKSYPCTVHRRGAELFAGYSTTRTAVLAGPGWDVVEAQCLLSHRKLDPGIVDGVYGQQTIAAVIRLQKDAGLPADGVVGPHTWKALRG